MPAILAHSPVQLVAQLITRAHHSERIPTKPYDRKAHDSRMRDHEEVIHKCEVAMQRCMGFGWHTGVEL
jgi:hypothetical protein